MDKTYLKVCGESVHFYRMVDAADKTEDLLQGHFNATKALLRKSMKGHRVPINYDDGPVGGLPLGGG